MEVEIKNFFPAERQDKKGLLKGSLHIIVKLIEAELNVRGILVSRQKGKWFFRMPFRLGTCHKTGNSVTFPIFIFSNDELNKSLLDGIYKKAPAFIEEFLKANPQAIGAQKTVEHIKPKANVDDRKEAAPNAKKQALVETVQVKKVSVVSWQDPPPRKPVFTKGAAHARSKR
jgi:hypothetical protein